MLIAVSLSGQSALAEKRVALVIGNTDYKHTSALPNASHDAIDMTTALSGLGFVVVGGVDLDRSQTVEVVRDFAKKLRNADVGLFFYSGHGLQVQGANYLVPIDAKLADETDLEFSLVRVDAVMKQMERNTKTNLVFLDACRDNPLSRNLARSMGRARSGSIGTGLARIKSGIGTLIAFATEPDAVAYDGTGRNSPFTTALLKHIGTTGLDIANLLRRVRSDVIAETKRRQVPWSHSSLTASFSFKPEAPAAKETAAAQAAKASSELSSVTGQSKTDALAAIDLAFWEAIQKSPSAVLYKEYLRKFPTGHFSILARAEIDKLESKKVTEPAAAPSSDAPLPVRDVQQELARLGCDPGEPDGIWGRRGKKALQSFAAHSKLKIVSLEPTATVLETLRQKSGRVCPVQCGKRYVKRNNTCELKTCPQGQTLTSNGQCLDQTAAVSPTAYDGSYQISAVRTAQRNKFFCLPTYSMTLNIKNGRAKHDLPLGSNVLTGSVKGDTLNVVSLLDSEGGHWVGKFALSQQSGQESKGTFEWAGSDRVCSYRAKVVRQ
ncbi:MAG: caspase family protein [Pseudomonadota bacterium]